MYSKRIMKIIPIITNVAAWIKAETGIGPSIASGNQTCKPNCVDFVAVVNSKKFKIFIVDI